MKVLLLITLAFLSVVLGFSSTQKELAELRISSDEEAEWKLFKIQNQKKFRSKERELVRKETFVNNLRAIKEHNVNNSETTYELGINPFADWTVEELESLKGEIDTEIAIPGTVMSDNLLRNAVPVTVDWRKSPCMPPVKKQGGCGSCYTFAAIATVEFQHCNKTGNLVLLSEENLVDCSQTYGNAGCQGGLALNAFNYIKDMGIDTDESYPYEGEETSCSYSKDTVAAGVVSWEYATKNWDEEAIKVAVALNGPVAVSVDASRWNFYSQGVYSDPYCSKTKTNHAVVIVGYGKDEKTGKNIWMIRNSWGPRWGDKGYIYMDRGVGMCAIGKRAVYPSAR